MFYNKHSECLMCVVGDGTPEQRPRLAHSGRKVRLGSAMLSASTAVARVPGGSCQTNLNFTTFSSCGKKKRQTINRHNTLSNSNRTLLACVTLHGPWHATLAPRKAEGPVRAGPVQLHTLPNHPGDTTHYDLCKTDTDHLTHRFGTTHIGFDGAYGYFGSSGCTLSGR